MKLKFSDRFSKNPQIEDFMKTRPVEAELFYADRQADGQMWRDQQSLFTILRRRLKYDAAECDIMIIIWR